MMRKIKTLYNRTLLLRAMACGLILTVLLNLAGFSARTLKALKRQQIPS